MPTIELTADDFDEVLYAARCIALHYQSIASDSRDACDQDYYSYTAAVMRRLHEQLNNMEILNAND